ncbi:dihydrolipoamide dehydrogenase [Alteribacillus persepolensis]|uniref:Dihydrolipoyl dehydrogenase n=1 Tax=Alteribacillus persepolensis TaxID=568899 RepID=A0A1G8D3U2_9BACI|nr:dihydrolipoyl dehydrogenase [Alteribacillus persepolensis]SDH51830.1 dihydrolipoamide dehydrogenase [Alteribacillus persepolensis]
MPKEYDLVILGAGTGGYVAAIKAAKAGLKTAIVEKEKVGGTCLHRGCIPSKSLLKSAEMHALMKDSDKYGIAVNDVTLHFDKVQQRKNQVVEQLYQGVQALMAKGDIDIYQGHGRILGPSIFSPTAGTVSIEMNNKSENVMLLPKNLMVATGSKPRELPGLRANGENILTSDEALQLKELPSSIVIIGGGVIGIEWASMLSDFDVDVTVLENAERILPGEDAAISKEMTKQLMRRGIRIVTSANVESESCRIGEHVSISAAVEGKKETFAAEKLLLSVGRKANVEDIGLENTNIEVENGFIKTNAYYQTKESHIYAIGDVIGGMQLAHVASKEGAVAVDHITNKKPFILDEQSIPRCTYSRPETASVGLTEEQAKQKGLDVKTGIFSFQAIGKAVIEGNTDGFVKLIADKQTDDLLGVHMIGSRVTELISEASLAKVVDASAFEVAETIHPHPSLSEIIGESALSADGKAIHS